MNDNPIRALISSTPMHVRQVILVILCCLINSADGYDVLSLALAAPTLAKEWGVTPQHLGIAFSATSVGLVFGAMLVAPLADRVGRRTVVLAALVDITIVHFLSSATHSIWVMTALRLAMGLGLGTLVVSLNVLVAEFSNDRWRNVLLAILHAGFSLGSTAGGFVAAWVLEPYGWRYIFIVGGVMNVAILLIAIIFLLESPEHLSSSQPRHALNKINSILARMRKPALTALPPKVTAGKPKVSVAALLTPEHRPATMLLWVSAFTFSIVGYFLMNWKPQILVNAGMTPTQASYVGVINGVFGILGHLSIALLAKRLGETWVCFIYFAMMVVMLVVFGTIPASPAILLGTSGVLNLFTVGAYTGLFLVALKLYGTEMRNAGVGFMVGWQRAGAIIGPMLGGLLIGAKLDRTSTFAVFAVIAVLPVISMFLAARLQSQRREADLTMAS